MKNPIGLDQIFGLNVGDPSYRLVNAIFSKKRIDFGKLLFEPGN